jgi:hypothetical protein
MDNQRDIRIITRKLGREKAYGLAHIEEKVIEIDPRQKPKTLLDTELHEFFHIRHPEWSESKVCREARAATKFLWSLKYRKINE